MDARFRVPIATMLAGIGVWVAFLVLHARGGAFASLWLAIAWCVFSGVLVVVSSFTCLRARGPAVGQVVRFVLLCVMGAVTLWVVNDVPAAAFGLAALVVVAVGVVAFRRPAGAEGSP